MMNKTGEIRVKIRSHKDIHAFKLIFEVCERKDIHRETRMPH